MIAIMHQKTMGIYLVFVSILALLGGIIFVVLLLPHGLSRWSGKAVPPQSQALSINGHDTTQFTQIGPIRMISK